MSIIKNIAYALCGFAIVGCSDSSPVDVEQSVETVKEKESDENDPKMNELKDQLTAARSEFEKTAPAELVTLFEKGVTDIKNTGVEGNAKNMNDKAPDFTLKNANGEEVTLSSRLAEGPVVLTWYRGGWCPYCNMSLNNLQQRLPEFKEAGASLIAITPEVPDKSMTTQEKHALEFDVLSDVGNVIGKEYGVVYTLTPEIADSYSNFFDIKEYNGDDSQELPLSATYVIAQDGTIQYAFLDAEYRNRAEPSEILDVLKGLK